MVKHIGLLVADWDDQQQSPNIFPNISRLLREKSCKILNPGRWSRFRVRIRYTIYSAKRTCVFKRFSSIRSETAHRLSYLGYVTKVFNIFGKLFSRVENIYSEQVNYEIPRIYMTKYSHWLFRSTKTFLRFAAIFGPRKHPGDEVAWQLFCNLLLAYVILYFLQHWLHCFDPRVRVLKNCISSNENRGGRTS